jgi:hypothetical protein
MLYEGSMGPETAASGPCVLDRRQAAMLRMTS